MTSYPSELERSGLLRDGRSIFIRPARPDDLDQVLRFSGRLSRRTVSYRMLGPVVTMDRRATENWLNADYRDRMTLLATLGGEVIGIAEYTRGAGQQDRAEIAFTVEDEYQGFGLGGLLLEHLAAAARDRGIAVFEADVLAENAPMLRAFQSSGYRMEWGEPGSVWHADIAIDPRRQVIARSDRRAGVATRSSLHRLMSPRSVAVIGANRRRRTVGNSILHNLVSGGFGGALYAVNPYADEIEGVPCVPSVGDVPEPVDLAVVAVPAASVPDVLAQCAERNVGAAVVVTTGVGGEQAREAGAELARFARGHGMRLVGPNCMGLINLRPDTRLVATFSPALPPVGGVSMASQSGPLGLAVLDHAQRLGLGFSGFVSLGDSVDVSPNDLLQWWETDRSTSVVLLHLERFGNPRNFARIARRVAARKPVIAVQPGPSRPPDTGFDHAATRPADSDIAVSALFTQAGVIRAHTMQEMFDTALLLANQPVPSGPRVAILTNAGGPGALTAGACRAAGLLLSTPSEETKETIRSTAKQAVEVGNPVDLTPMASGGDYRKALRALLADDEVDAVIVLFIPPLVDQTEEVASAMVEESARVPTKPVLSSFLSQSGLPEPLRREDGRHIPSYLFPESAATALGHASAYGDWRRRPAGVAREPAGLDLDCARELVTRHGRGWLDEEPTAELLGCFGLHRVAPDRPVPAEGQDLSLGVVDDPIFGPVVALGLAGDYAKVFGDVAFRITPVSDRDAEAMVRSLRGYPLLAGLGGRPAVDVGAVVDAVQRVSTMVDRIPELAELTVERMRVGPPGAGVVLLDATLRLEPPPATRMVREPAVDPG